MMRNLILFLLSVLLLLSCSKNSWLEESLVDPDHEYGQFTPAMAVKGGSYKIANDTLYAEFDLFACQFINDHDYKDNGFYLPYSDPIALFHDFGKLEEFTSGSITRPAIKTNVSKEAKPIDKYGQMYVLIDISGRYITMFKERIRPYLYSISKSDYKKISLVMVQRHKGKYSFTIHDLKGDKAGPAINQLDNPDLKYDSVCFYEALDKGLDFIINTKNTNDNIDLMYIENSNINTFCGPSDHAKMSAIAEKMNTNKIRFSATDIYGANNYREYSFFSRMTGGIHIPSFEPAMFADPNNIYFRQLLDPSLYRRIQVKYKLKNYIISEPVFLYNNYSELDGYKIPNLIYCLPE